MPGQDPDELPVHPVLLQLPWYVTGTLSAPETQEVEEHLRHCASCRAELAELQVMHRGVVAAEADQPAPDLLRIVKNRIAPPVHTRKVGIGESLLDTLQALFAPKWVSAAAVVLILVQSGALVWMNRGSPSPAVITTRGLDSPATRLRIVFQPGAAEQDTRRLLLDAHARLVAGPTAEGVYIVEVATVDAARVEQTLADLSAHPGLVRSVERAIP